MKLRDVSLSYALPSSVASRLGPMKRLELSIGAHNLWTLTRYSGLDPEVPHTASAVERSHDIAPVPPTRSYWLSITAGI